MSSLELADVDQFELPVLGHFIDGQEISGDG